MSHEMTLYHYWRSSASWRIRLALEWKGLSIAGSKSTISLVHVGLLDGEVESPAHIARNPMGQVPALQVGNRFLIESMAIVEWLDEKYSFPPLIPGDAFQKAHIRSVCEIINAGIQPFQNINTLDMVSPNDEERKKWSRFFIRRGFDAIQKLLAPTRGKYCFGNDLTAADFFLIPQCYAALRNDIDLKKEFPLIAELYSNALELELVQKTKPEQFEPRK